MKGKGCDSNPESAILGVEPIMIDESDVEITEDGRRLYTVFTVEDSAERSRPVQMELL